MKDRYGNTVNITVDGKRKGSENNRFSGSSYNITYENGYIKTISDPIGRSVIYDYENGNLVRGKIRKVTTPAIRMIPRVICLKSDHSNNLESISYLHASGENQHKVDYTVDAHGNQFTYSYDNVRVNHHHRHQRTTNVKWYDTYSITNSVDAEGRSKSLNTIRMKTTATGTGKKIRHRQKWK